MIVSTGKCLPGNCYSYEENWLAWNLNGIGEILLTMFVQGVVFALIVLYVEFPLFHLPSLSHGLKKELIAPEVDADVATEKHTVERLGDAELRHNDDVIVTRLTKYFGRSCVVNSLSVRINAGECFGLLGVNGAGKTTTFRMLTGEIQPSSGTTYLEGSDIRSRSSKVIYSIRFRCRL